MAGWASAIPLVILFIVVGVGAFVGYSMYTWSGELADRANKKMEKKNMTFSKDGGLRVGVKELGDDNYADKTQNVLVNVWNNAAFPAYKSRLGWNSTQGGGAASGSSGGQSAAAKGSGSQSTRPAATSSGSSGSLAPAQSRPKRSTSPVPGSW